MMPRQILLTLSLAAVSLVFVSETRAETPAQRAYGFGIGIGFNYGPGGASGTTIGFVPFYYPGFWGNGMSMYGPPVATYGIVPGTFGASDYGTTQSPPLFGVPIGSFRHDYAPSALDEKMIALPIDGKMIIVEAHVPIDNAVVFFNDQVTKTRGLVRLFSSTPNLKPGETYQYTVRAEWIIDGFKISKTVKVSGKPGERLVADFVQ
jgi:uncharacterized protein (TIGR03000 family)